MGMDEHFICYFIEKYEKRPAAERQMIEFMASLKYYAEIWSRAKLFAQIIGFYQTEDYFFNKRHSGTSDNRFPARINDGILDETEYQPFNDVYS